jgi:hypothetical protein
MGGEHREGNDAYIEESPAHDFEQERKDREAERKDLKLTITLTDNPNVKRGLVLKLEEYRERLEKEKAINKKADPNSFTDTIYKIALLARLLSDDSVNTEDIAKDLSNLYGGINRRDFENAMLVISDYAKAGADRKDRGVKPEKGK